MRLRELGVFTKSSYDIAERMVAEEITDPDQAEEIFRATLEATRDNATSEGQAIVHAVARLRQGAWSTGSFTTDGEAKPVTISLEATSTDRRL